MKTQMDRKIHRKGNREIEISARPPSHWSWGPAMQLRKYAVHVGYEHIQMWMQMKISQSPTFIHIQVINLDNSTITGFPAIWVNFSLILLFSHAFWALRSRISLSFGSSLTEETEAILKTNSNLSLNRHHFKNRFNNYLSARWRCQQAVLVLLQYAETIPGTYIHLEININ